MEIIITEEQKDYLHQHMVNENCEYCDKILKIKDFLDKTFIKGSLPTQLMDGKPVRIQVVVMVDNNKQPLSSMSDKEAFEYLQCSFPDIITQDRDQFLKDCLLAWYEDRISPSGVILLHKH